MRRGRVVEGEEAAVRGNGKGGRSCFIGTADSARENALGAHVRHPPAGTVRIAQIWSTSVQWRIIRNRSFSSSPDNPPPCNPVPAMPPPKKPFLTFGLPFLTFMVVGLQGLTYITHGRYEVSSRVTDRKQKFLKTNTGSTNAHSDGHPAHVLQMSSA